MKSPTREILNSAFNAGIRWFSRFFKKATAFKAFLLAFFAFLVIFIFLPTREILIKLNVFEPHFEAQKHLEEEKKLPFFPQPFEAKSIYVTGFVAGDKKRMSDLIDLVKKTELNSVVIDIKDWTGKIFFKTENSALNRLGAFNIIIPDLPLLLEDLHKEGIYAIARIAVFQDDSLAQKRPDLALKNKTNGKIWRDYKKIAWLDPSSIEVQDYNIEIALTAAKLGFDEVNFDYIRFPSDGAMTNVVYPFWDAKEEKHQVIKNFFERINSKLKPLGIIMSADLFGLTTWRDDDMNIGQRIIDAAPYFDYISPMVYPSHYPTGFQNFKNPADHPYEIIYESLVRGQNKLTEFASNNQTSVAFLRPWLQDFDLGAAYDGKMVKLEKKAVYDAKAFGWLLWNSANNYTIEGLER